LSWFYPPRFVKLLTNVRPSLPLLIPFPPIIWRKLFMFLLNLLLALSISHRLVVSSLTLWNFLDYSTAEESFFELGGANFHPVSGWYHFPGKWEGKNINIEGFARLNNLSRNVRKSSRVSTPTLINIAINWIKLHLLIAIRRVCKCLQRKICGQKLQFVNMTVCVSSLPRSPRTKAIRLKQHPNRKGES
jgi:hypothetical protein